MKRYTLFIVFFCLMTMICIEPKSIQATELMPRLEEAKWLVLGPFPNPSGTNAWEECQGFNIDYLQELGGEGKARPKEGQVTSGRTWVYVQATDGVIDFTQIYGGLENSVAYGYLEFQSSTRQTVALKLGSDDGIKVWCNGNLLLSNHLHRPLNPGDDVIRVPVQSGLNRLLVKVDQGVEGWGFVAKWAPLYSTEKDQETSKTAVGLAIYPENHLISTAEPVICTVMTEPTMALDAEVEVVFSSEDGEVLGKKRGFLGEPLELILPRTFTGVALLRAEGVGGLQGLSGESLVLVGAVEEIIERLIQESQEVLAEVGEAKTVTEPVKQRLLSTFNYWEDQLRGDVDASLATKKKNLQALREMVTLLRQVRKGLNTKGKIQLEMAGEVRQWAYRSKIDGTDQPYSLYVPSSYDPKRAYSLLIGLHGYSGDDVESLQKLLGGYRPEDFLVVAPLGRGDLGYRSLGEVDVLDVIQEIQTFYHINPDRIYLTGWSMGGSGTWRLGQLYPHRFAAIAPFCGWTGISFLVNMRNLPAMVVHGAADPVVPVYLDQMAANFLQEYLGAPLDYHELPGVGHDVWTEWVKLKGNKGLFDYFRKHKRNPWPKRVSIIINHLRYAKQYWVEVQELATPLAVGQMDVRVIDDKNITVQTKDVAAFTLNLTHPDLAQTGTVMVKVDGVDIRVPAGQEEAFFCVQEESGLFHSRKPPKRSRVKNEGGGLSDLFTSSLYIVYGTRVPERREALRRMAEIIADWRVGPEMRMGVKVGKFRVKADRDITEEEIKGSSLLLLGSPAENRLLERIQVELPVKWMKDGVEVEEVYYPQSGFTLVCPNPLAPRKLLGIISLPFSPSGNEVFLRQLRFTLCTYGLRGEDSASVTTPDLMVVDDTGRIRHIASYDADWENLIPVH